MLKNIKRSIADSSLKSQLSSAERIRPPHKFSFESMRTVAILMDATNTEDYELVKRYVVYLREHRKKVKVLGYFHTKEVPSLTYSKLEYDFFSVRDVNWLGKPNSTVINNFIDEEWDLLIDLNIHDHFPLRYIAALSRARFKVGKYKAGDEIIYDMMIDSDNTKTLKYFLRQVDTYVAMMNKSE
jgi:hypothetical protein